uniref:Uncharacterized protein n=1 Tax=Arundo donax TaxID=35708 RepID=A0A0A9B1I4_ARUDO
MTTVAGGNAGEASMPAAAAAGDDASWVRSAPGGRNARHIQSVRGTETMGAPWSRSSAGVRSSPPKKGWMAMRPARRTWAKEDGESA